MLEGLYGKATSLKNPVRPHFDDDRVMVQCSLDLTTNPKSLSRTADEQNRPRVHGGDETVSLPKTFGHLQGDVSPQLRIGVSDSVERRSLNLIMYANRYRSGQDEVDVVTCGCLFNDRFIWRKPENLNLVADRLHLTTFAKQG